MGGFEIIKEIKFNVLESQEVDLSENLEQKKRKRKVDDYDYEDDFIEPFEGEDELVDIECKLENFFVYKGELKQSCKRILSTFKNRIKRKTKQVEEKSTEEKKEISFTADVNDDLKTQIEAAIGISLDPQDEKKKSKTKRKKKEASPKVNEIPGIEVNQKIKKIPQKEPSGQIDGKFREEIKWLKTMLVIRHPNLVKKIVHPKVKPQPQFSNPPPYNPFAYPENYVREMTPIGFDKLKNEQIYLQKPVMNESAERKPPGNLLGYFGPSPNQPVYKRVYQNENIKKKTENEENLITGKLIKENEMKNEKKVDNGKPVDVKDSNKLVEKEIKTKDTKEINKTNDDKKEFNKVDNKTKEPFVDKKENSVVIPGINDQPVEKVNEEVKINEQTVNKVNEKVDKEGKINDQTVNKVNEKVDKEINEVDKIEEGNAEEIKPVIKISTPSENKKSKKKSTKVKEEEVEDSPICVVDDLPSSPSLSPGTLCSHNEWITATNRDVLILYLRCKLKVMESMLENKITQIFFFYFNTIVYKPLDEQYVLNISLLEKFLTTRAVNDSEDFYNNVNNFFLPQELDQFHEVLQKNIEHSFGLLQKQIKNSKMYSDNFRLFKGFTNNSFQCNSIVYMYLFCCNEYYCGYREFNEIFERAKASIRKEFPPNTSTNSFLKLINIKIKSMIKAGDFSI